MNNPKDVCYILIDSSNSQKMTDANLKDCLEYGPVEVKRKALKEVIVSLANGECNDAYLIHIIRFVLPMQDHTIKKLLMIFWELYPKTNSQGELIKEMILICDAFRKDLQHPNEYIRGSTLRFLCKLKHPEILEPLIGTVRACLNHKRPYVRRNAVLAIYSIHKNYNYLIPDAPKLIEEFLNCERDTSCKRNAFIMLLNTDMDKAVYYLISSLDHVHSFDHSLQIVIIELIQKICQKNSHEKSGFIRCIYTLLDSKNHAVRYEAAKALIMLTSAPTALKATVNCYIDIILKANDNTTKLIVLDRLIDMKYHLQRKRIMQESVQSILTIVSKNNDVKVKVKTIELISELITEFNIGHVIKILKKECLKEDLPMENDSYKILIARKLHEYYKKFPTTSDEIIQFFNKLLTLESDEKVQLNILTLLKEAAERFEHVQRLVVSKLKDKLYTINSVEVYYEALWIIAEFNTNPKAVEEIIEYIYQTVKEVINFFNTNDQETVQQAMSKYVGQLNCTHILESEIESSVGEMSLTKPLLSDILKNTGYRATGIAYCAVKLVEQNFKKYSVDEYLLHSLTNKTMYIITVILILNKVRKSYDSCCRLDNCFLLLIKPNQQLFDHILKESKSSLRKMLDSQSLQENNDSKNKWIKVMQPDEPIRLLQNISQTVDIFELDYLENANYSFFEENYRLDKYLQLTGLSDPIYSEARLVHANEHNITMYITLINRTKEILQNCSVELASSGDLIITDRAQPKTLEPNGKAEIKVDVKVELTGNSIIFGNIVYDTTKTSEHATIILRDIPIDVVDYIKPAKCEQEYFRKMWLEFEWENKVFVSPKEITSLTQYLNLVTKSLKMQCLTPLEAMSGDCRFLTANLYGKTIFGENVIANLSIEKDEQQDKITGHVRLRAKSQGIVLGLGDIIRYLKC